MQALSAQTPAERARFVRNSIPAEGLFQGQEWRISPEPFPLGQREVEELESLGRVLLQFYRGLNLLYQQSAQGKQPPWVAQWLDQGKPGELVDLQRSPGLKNELPRVIRPDILLTEDGFRIVELDSVPGGIGLTAWLNRTYAEFAPGIPASKRKNRLLLNPDAAIVGGVDGMLRGFAEIFGGAKQVHIVVSEEAATYRPEMEWVCQQLDGDRFKVRDTGFSDFGEGDAVYRFFEMFDVANVSSSARLFELAREKKIRLTPPPKPVLEEKMMFALLWNRNLQGFWRQQLGESFFGRMQKLVPYTWLVDPTPLPPHGAIPELNVTDWQQLKGMSQRERDLILKISGFSNEAWGARGVYLGSDLSHEEWSTAVDKAITDFARAPYILQRYHKPAIVPSSYFDFAAEELKPMPGRARLCPYYFVHGEADAARAYLGGVLATVAPADKKIIHGMRDAVLVPCVQGNER